MSTQKISVLDEDTKAIHLWLTNKLGVLPIKVVESNKTTANKKKAVVIHVSSDSLKAEPEREPKDQFPDRRDYDYTAANLKQLAEAELRHRIDVSVVVSD